MPPRVHWIDQEQIGAPVPLRAQPPWLQEYRHFLMVNRLLDGTGEWLLRCRVCDLSLGLDPKVARKLPADPGLAVTIVRLAGHGLQHAMDGELPRE